MRDSVAIPFHDHLLVIACDNSGAIGKKEQDAVFVPYETVGYYSFRVAVMECMAAGGVPFSVVLQNFCGNDAWNELVSGIQTGLAELDLQNIPVTGSTESNFQLVQSAIGLMVLGKKEVDKKTELSFSEGLQFAVVGKPLVGNDVVELKHQVAPLSVFKEVSKLDNVMLWPVGSKGILYELTQMYPSLNITNIVSELDVTKSSGPSTCFIITYHPDQEDDVKRLTEGYLHPLKIEK